MLHRPAIFNGKGALEPAGGPTIGRHECVYVLFPVLGLWRTSAQFIKQVYWEAGVELLAAMSLKLNFYSLGMRGELNSGSATAGAQAQFMGLHLFFSVS